MRSIEIDFVRRRSSWVAWVVLGIALFLSVDAGRAYFEMKGTLAADGRRIEAPATPAPAEENLPVQTQRELENARRVLLELTLPWEGLFRSVETAAGKHVALLSIEPDAGRGQVRVTGETRDYVSALNFMVRLEEGRVLERVHLISHELREDDPHRPYRFALVGYWRAQP